MKVIIVGAGIGGLTTALSLQQVGIEIKVFEAAAQILPIGVGINILPHASRELCELGLKEEIDRFAIRTNAMNYYTSSGKLVISDPCGTHAGYEWPQWSIHRGELQSLLLHTLQQRAGADKVVIGAQLSNFVQTGTKVTAHFTNPDTGNIFSEDADLLIGADGLHSATRRKMFPREGKPLYSGLVAYRGAVVSQPYLDGQSMVTIGDKRQRLVSFPMTKQQPKVADSKCLINWIAYLPVAENKAPSEDWDKESEQQALASKYENWQFNWINIPKLIRNTERIYEFPLYDRDPHRQWTFGRVTLLGDAAHPMIPVSSSGATHAIIDARALAYALARSSDPMTGLVDYENDRLQKANRVVEVSRDNGPDEVLEIAYNRCPENAEYVHEHVSHSELQQVISQFKKASGFDLQTLQQAPSYTID